MTYSSACFDQLCISLTQAITPTYTCIVSMIPHFLFPLLFLGVYPRVNSVLLDDFQVEYEQEIHSIYENSTMTAREKVLTIGEVINDFNFDNVNPVSYFY